MKKHFTQSVCIMLVALFMVGCATSKKVQVVKIGDNELTCEKLLKEIEKLDKVQAGVDSNKGMTGTNVAAAIFWLPGLAYTFYDADSAEKLITKRKSHITNLYNQKECFKKPKVK